MNRKRVSFSISSDPDTVEGRLVNHLRDNKMLNMRESVLRALKAYYLPWAYEDEVSTEEAQVLARNAIDELEFRIFQIRRHFLQGEAYGPKLGADSGGDVGATPEVKSPKKTRSSQKKTGQKTGSQQMAPKPDPTSLPEMLKDTDIDPDVLDDF